MSGAALVHDYLEVPPTSCIAVVDQLDWAGGLLALRAGEHVLGLRTNTPEVASLVREIFDRRLVPDAQPDRNYSLALIPRSETGLRELHRVYRNFVRTMRTRSARRALDTLWHELDMRDARTSRQQRLADVVVFVRDGQAHLLPGALRRPIIDDLRRWERDGFRLVERAWVTIDLDAAEIVIPRPAYPLSDGDLDHRLAELDLDDPGGGPSIAGRFPIVSWTTDAGTQGTAMRAGQAGMTLVDRKHHLDPATLQQLAEIIGQVADLGPSWQGLDELRAGLHRLQRS